MPDNIFRILDVNVNRVSEGLRVIEDFSRFITSSEYKTVLVRTLRHNVRESLKIYDNKFLLSRDSISDFGSNFTTVNVPVNCEDCSVNTKQTITANFKRVQEGLRSIEENLKILGDNKSSQYIQKLRFESYSIEQLYSKPTFPDGLYCITASNFSNGRSNIEVVKSMLDGGCKILQYREKYKSISEKYREAEEIKKLTDKYKTILIINDHPEIAMAIDADGVHIGQDDMPIDAVRKVVGAKIIGLSTHSPVQAVNAKKAGADYIGVGPIFATKTKDNVCDPVGLEYAEFAHKNVDIPFYVIGGLKEHNIHLITGIGIKKAVVVTDVTTAENITEKFKILNKKLIAG